MKKKHKATKAIILAAGIGRRLCPITNTTPKPLIEVGGTKMIETLLDALVKNEIENIIIVTGHLKEKFNYLTEKYNHISITFLENPYYADCNNISSLYIARDYLGDCIITDGDMIIHNPKILNPHFDASGYCSAWTEDTDEWLQTIDDEDYVLSCSRTGGHKGWQLYSISFWTNEDGTKLRRHLEKTFERDANTNIFWDDIPMFCFKEEYHLKIRRINAEDLIEIDSLYELCALDSSYLGRII